MKISFSPAPIVPIFASESPTTLGTRTTTGIVGTGAASGPAITTGPVEGPTTAVVVGPSTPPVTVIDPSDGPAAVIEPSDRPASRSCLMIHPPRPIKFNESSNRCLSLNSHPDAFPRAVQFRRSLKS